MESRLRWLSWACLGLAAPAVGFDYNPQHTLTCSAISSQELRANLQQLWNILILHDLDRYTFMAVCPIIFCLQLLILITYLRNRSLLARPGNIFFGVVGIECVLNLLLLTFSVYDSVHDLSGPMPSHFIQFCSVTAFLEGLFTILHFFYICLFLMYTIFLFRFSLKKKSSWFWNVLHLLVIGFSLACTVGLYLLDFMGLNLYGLCGLTPTRLKEYNITLPALELVFAGLFCLTGVFTHKYFRKHMPGGEVFRRKKHKEGRIIFLYVLGFSTVFFLTGLISLLMNLNCISDRPLPALTVMSTIANLLRVCSYIYLIAVLFAQDNFRGGFKRMLRNLFQRSLSKRASSDSPEYSQMDSGYGEHLFRQNEIDLLLVSQIYTIISGVYIANYEYNSQEDACSEIRPIHFQESISFSLDQQSIANYECTDRAMLHLKALSCDMVLHAPRIFRQLLEGDGLARVYESFNIADNFPKIWNLTEGDGGRSGEFFFFSSDNRFVVKTVTAEEFSFLQHNIEFFYDHFRRHPHSLLAKIYGLYTIKGNEMQRTYRIILMKNILGCPRKQVLRIYDMKGSKHDRQVIKDQAMENHLSKLTLKDIDFMNYEGKIRIAHSLTMPLRRILHSDSLFLKQLNLIDYSLLVVRVAWPQPCLDPAFWGEFQRIGHSENAGEYYHIGIIDYMQKWDLQKMGEKWWKNLTGKKDVSAAEPNHYHRRFMQFVDEIVAVMALNEKERELREMPSRQGVEEHQPSTSMREQVHPGQH